MDIDFKNYSEFDDHKLVIRFEDKKTNLLGFVAIHNDKLGPAVGGTRMFPYVSEEEALKDVLRLSKAMSYKCALSGVKYGGGKAVIIGDPQKIKTEDLVRSYAREIGNLKGKFTTGEDVGITEEDVQIMFEEAPYFIGKKGYAGDPSPFAALSTFYSIQVACEELLRVKNLKGIKVAVKGVGKVGTELVRFLLNEKAIVYVADIKDLAIKNLKDKYPDINIVNSLDIHRLDVDVYAPCAMGNEFNDESKTEIKAKIICGSANNQLATNVIGDWFHENGILYIPDYIANAGGLIDVVDELEPGGFNKSRVDERIKNIKITVKKVIEDSKAKNISTIKEANDLAVKILKN